jgi:maltooligosyltrehalose trehalohydrolase
MPSCHHSLPFGAELLSADATRFRLWAPDARSVALVLPERANFAVPLERSDGGWFECTAQVGAGAQYLYRIDDELNVPDPGARYAPRGLQGPSEVIDPKSFDWQDSQWRGLEWHRAVLYELHVGTFTEEGTFAAISARLRDLADVGINTIELLPIATFAGQRGWGYDGVLLFAPHPAYGRPDDLKRLVQAAHELGIAVVLDVVYNHFGPEGNYLHRYARGFFTDRYQTPWGAAIDFESAAGRRVRDFFIANALYWLNEYRLDGLRLDAVHAIRDASEVHFVDELAQMIERGPGRDRHVHLILENHDNQVRRLRPAATPHVSKAQWNDDFHHVAHVLLTNERDGYYAHYAQHSQALLGRVLAEGFAYQGEAYGAADEPRGERSVHMPGTAFIDFLQNHDQIGNRAYGDRIAALTTPEQLRMGLAVLLLTPHVPMLFMGEEYAATQPFLYFCDYTGELAEAITAGRRREFATFSAFADEAARARIPDPNARESFERSRLQWRERLQEPHRTWLAYVKELLHVRTTQVIPRMPQLVAGSGRYEHTREWVVARWSVGHKEVLQLGINVSAVPVPLASAADERLLYSSLGKQAEEALQPWEVRLSIARP